MVAARAAAPNQATFERELNALVKSSGLNVGVAIKDLVTNEEFLIGADGVFPQGSCIRIHLISELYRQAAAGKLSVDEIRTLPESARTGGTGVLRYMKPGSVSMSLRDYAVLIISANDHSAANFLTDIVGLENINASLAAQGTPEIKFQRKTVSRSEAKGLPENEATPRATMRALELLYRGAVVDRATSDAIIEVLAVPEVSYFRRDLPPGVLYAGRSGSGPTMRCDAGIVLLSDRPFVLCVMVKDLPISSRPRAYHDYSKADEFIASVTHLAMQYFGAGQGGAGRKSS
jgi:beta-lactamase class A